MDLPTTEAPCIESVQSSQPTESESKKVESGNVTAQSQPTPTESTTANAGENVDASVNPSPETMKSPVGDSKQVEVQQPAAGTGPTQAETETGDKARQSQPTQTEPNIEKAADVVVTQTESPTNVAATQTHTTEIKSGTDEKAASVIETQSQPTEIVKAQVDAGSTQAGNVETIPAEQPKTEDNVKPVQVDTPNVQSIQTEPEKSIENNKGQQEQDEKVLSNQGEIDRKRLQAMEIEINSLEKVGSKDDTKKQLNLSHDEKMEYEENAKLRKMVNELRETLREKNLTLTRKNLETEALEIQITALKEVTVLSKGMLDIRNTENLQLKEQIDSMEEKVSAERQRHNSLLQKAEKAATINTELQSEYHKQVALFGELKESYEKKLSTLQSEIKRLQALQNSSPP